MKTFGLFCAIVVVIILQACSTSKAVISHGIDLSKYSYVVFGKESTGDRELDDIVILKSSGIGLTISQDQNIALGAIRKKLKKVFGDKQ